MKQQPGDGVMPLLTVLCWVASQVLAYPMLSVDDDTFLLNATPAGSDRMPGSIIGHNRCLQGHSTVT
jgi:hypothetical protein